MDKQKFLKTQYYLTSVYSNNSGWTHFGGFDVNKHPTGDNKNGYGINTCPNTSPYFIRTAYRFGKKIYYNPNAVIQINKKYYYISQAPGVKRIYYKSRT